MTRRVYRFTLDERISPHDVRDSLFLSVFAAEGLHGRTQVLLDAAFCLDKQKRACVVDASTDVGRSIAQIFTGLLAREFGEDAFTVDRIDGDPPPPHSRADDASLSD